MTLHFCGQSCCTTGLKLGFFLVVIFGRMLTWWMASLGGDTMATLLFICVLSIPTSSAASERCWSVMGNVHSESRNRLTDDRVEKLVYIYFNERMLH